MTQADFIENCASTNSGNYVATACEDHLTIYNTRNEDVTIVHNTIGQRVTIFDVNDSEILYGTIWYMEPIAKVCAVKIRYQQHLFQWLMKLHVFSKNVVSSASCTVEFEVKFLA